MKCDPREAAIGVSRNIAGPTQTVLSAWSGPVLAIEKRNDVEQPGTDS